MIMGELQILLFDNGYTWPDGDTNIAHLRAYDIYINDGHIRVCLTPRYFDSAPETEMTIDELRRYFKPTLKCLLEE